MQKKLLINFFSNKGVFVFGVMRKLDWWLKFRKSGRIDNSYNQKIKKKRFYCQGIAKTSFSNYFSWKKKQFVLLPKWNWDFF